VPISISRDCRFFTVLQTLYYVSLQDGRITYTSHQMPVGSISETVTSKVTRNASGGYTVTPKDPTTLTYKDFSRFKRQNPQEARLFWNYLDDEGHHLCYVEQLDGLPTRFQVFRIEMLSSQGTHPRIQMRAMASRRFFTRDFGRVCDRPEEKDFEMCFHPTHPVIAYATAQGITIWNFAESELKW